MFSSLLHLMALKEALVEARKALEKEDSNNVHEWDGLAELILSKNYDQIVQDVKDKKFPLVVERKNSSGEPVHNCLLIKLANVGYLELFGRLLVVLPNEPMYDRGLTMTATLSTTPILYPFLSKWLEFCTANRPELIQIDYHDSSNPPALTVAALKDNLPAMNLLLKYGASATVVDGNGFNPFTFCVTKGYEAGMEVIRNHVGDQIVNTCDLFMRTPLHVAVEFGSDRVAKYLVCNGADITLKNSDDETPLKSAKTPISAKTAEFLQYWSQIE